jgi:hypothetical protein
MQFLENKCLSDHGTVPWQHLGEAEAEICRLKHKRCCLGEVVCGTRFLRYFDHNCIVSFAKY